MTFGTFFSMPKWLDGEAIVQRSADKGVTGQYRSGVVSLTPSPQQKYLGSSNALNTAFRSKLTRGRATGPNMAIRLKFTGGCQIRLGDIILEVNLDGGD